MSMKKEVYHLVGFMQDVLRKSRTKGFALGLSGGIDSAVCAALAQLAIESISERMDFDGSPNDYSLDLIMLPMGNHASDMEVAMEVAKHIGVEARTLEMGGVLEQFLSTLHPTTDGHYQPDAKCVGNLKARLRMSAIYYAANMGNLLVIGTDNASETYTGYFTKHGDGAADLFPLSQFSKREVYEIGRFLNLPESVLNRAPSAGLWEGQTDESEMGVPYDFIDNVVEDVRSLNVETYNDELRRKYYSILGRLHETTAHKRAAPPVYNRVRE